MPRRKRPIALQPCSIAVKRELLAYEAAWYLTDELGIEATLQSYTPFLLSGRKGEPVFSVCATCTRVQMEEAATHGLCCCIQFDTELIELGVLPPWPGGPDCVPTEGYC